MEHFSIAVAPESDSKYWKQKKMSWQGISKMLSTPVVENIKIAEFLRLPKAKQHDIKDSGCYFGGRLKEGRRLKKNVVNRQLLTLDIDFAHSDFWDDFTMLFGCAAIVHSTFKHQDKNPRLRLVIPLSRKVKPDEYVAIARRVAGDIDIELFDDTTFDVNRYMFLPSRPSDTEFYFRRQKGEFLDPDEVLAQYEDWTDQALWPVSERRSALKRGHGEKQQDPTLKSGYIGAFCRTYSIQEAIEQYLPETYEATEDGRFTYLGGSTASGLVIYDDVFAFSHHGTDPASGLLCNAFDLVRIHLFGELDEEETHRRKSFQAMEDMLKKDPEVKKTMLQERAESVNAAFLPIEDDEDREEYETETDEPEYDPENLDWQGDLEVTKQGVVASTAGNLSMIFKNDARLRKMFRMNRFDHNIYTVASLPWRKVSGMDRLKNLDYSGLRSYIETVYGITGEKKIEDALVLAAEMNAFHPVQEYLDGLEWDGVERIDTMLIDYFDAPDNEYTRKAMRVTLIGAVSRIFNKGSKFDTVLVLTGSEGTGKSTFVDILGKSWYSDSFLSVHGKESYEQIMGVWIMEVAELAGLSKAEVEAVKGYFSKKSDRFRPAYGRVTEDFPRQTIFIATTNVREFLKSLTGDRRFLPVDVGVGKILSVWDDLPSEVDMIWAEAVAAFRAGEKPYLEGKAAKLAKLAQKEHNEGDVRIGVIEDFAEKPVTRDWFSRSIDEMRMILDSGFDVDEDELVTREEISAVEVLVICFGIPLNRISRYNTNEINLIMKQLDGWEPSGKIKRFGELGRQRYYVRRSKKDA